MNLQNCIVASLNQASEQCFRPCLARRFREITKSSAIRRTSQNYHSSPLFTLFEPRMKGLPQMQDKEETRNLVRRIRLYILMRVLLNDLRERDATMFEAVRSDIRDCHERKRRREKGYENLAEPISARVQRTVGMSRWRKAATTTRKMLRMMVIEKTNRLRRELLRANAQPIHTLPTIREWQAEGEKADVYEK